MRKKIVLIGVVVLVIGIVIFAGGDAAILHYTVTDTAVKELATGQYGREITLTSSSLFTVSSTFPNWIVVTSSNYSKVTSGNYATYAISPIENTHVSSLYVKGYDLGTGSYYLLAFNSSQPPVTYSYLPLSVSYLSLLSVFGIVLLIIGIIIAIIGVILKRKEKTGDEIQV
ncbi:hypothetical protein [Thermoplasma volcanium]|nr:hypothetical protein [Thermoplasma volcanium]